MVEVFPGTKQYDNKMTIHILHFGFSLQPLCLSVNLQASVHGET